MTLLRRLRGNWVLAEPLEKRSSLLASLLAACHLGYHKQVGQALHLMDGVPGWMGLHCIALPASTQLATAIASTPKEQTALCACSSVETPVKLSAYMSVVFQGHAHSGVLMQSKLRM